MKWTLGLLAGWIVCGGCHTVPDKSWPQQAGQHVMESTLAFHYDYLFYLPDEYNETDQNWPLVLFLHGAGERGDDVTKVGVHGLPQLAAEGKKFPFIVVSPQCPAEQWWPQRVESLMALVDEIARHYRVDQNRIYVTGLSMGGFGTWALASSYPKRFAAIAPICGGGQPYLASNLKSIPVWAFHGGMDNVVPLKQSQEMVDAVKSAGGDARLTVYPEAGHDSWTETYQNEELYRWLLSHSKQ